MTIEPTDLTETFTVAIEFPDALGDERYYFGVYPSVKDAEAVVAEVEAIIEAEWVTPGYDTRGLFSVTVELLPVGPATATDAVSEWIEEWVDTNV